MFLGRAGYSVMNTAGAATMDATVEYMIRSHLSDVVEVEKAAWTISDPDFGDFVCPLAWGEDRFVSEVRRKNTVLFVVLEGDLVVGYACVSKEKNRNTNTIERLVVHPQFCRRGLGSTLLFDIMTRSNSVKYQSQVREHDDTSIAFFASLGWTGKFSRNLYGRDRNGIVFSQPQ